MHAMLDGRSQLEDDVQELRPLRRGRKLFLPCRAEPGAGVKRKLCQALRTRPKAVTAQGSLISPHTPCDPAHGCTWFRASG